MSRLVLFARARELAGRSNDDIDATTLGELLERATAVVNVRTVGPDRFDRPDPDTGVLVDQAADDPTALPAERAAERHLDAKVGDHLGHPGSCRCGPPPG